jgi:uncharacterized protein
MVMDIELGRLSAQETPVRGEVRVRDPDGSLAADRLSFPEPFRVEAIARRDARGVVVVTGSVTGGLLLECGRCLAQVPLPIDTDFDVRFAEAGAAPHPAPRAGADDEEGGIELSRDDLDISFLPASASVIRLEDLVREQALLQVPIRPLCRPDCAGLCQRCGADLNASDCGCPEDAVATTDARLLALAAFKKKPANGGPT